MRASIAALSILATLFLSLAPISSSTLPANIPAAQATSRTIVLTGRVSTGWNGSNPGPTLHVTQGDSVSINLVSGDGFPHTFVVDVAHAGITPSPNCTIDKCSSQFTSTTTFTFTADMPPGKYTYYCSIHLMMMYGSIMVESGAIGTPDFTAISSPTTIVVAQGSTGSTVITLTSQNGFSGPVTLAVTVSPSGPQAQLGSTTVTVPAKGSTSTTLTISTSSTGLYSTPIAQGAYTVAVSEISGSLSHSTEIPLTVGSTSSNPTSTPGYMYGSTNSPSNTSLLIGTIAILAALAVVTSVVLVRRRK